MNPFEAYSKRANTHVSHPARLLGPNKTRSDARVRYGEIVAELASFSDSENLEIYLIGMTRELAQFQAELDFYWEGDGDFLGLQKEIERARARVDDGLDFPRYEVKETGQ